MNESKLTTIAQIEDFLAATPDIEFSGISDARDVERYAHISRVLKRFDTRAVTNERAGFCLSTCAAPPATAAHKSRD